MPGSFGRPNSEDDVAAVGFVLKPRIRKDKMRIQSWMLRDEAGQNWRELLTTQIRRRADLQQAARYAAARRDLGFRITDLIEDRSAALIEQ